MRAVRRVRVARAADPFLVWAVALAVYTLHGHSGILDRDLGVFTYGGEHVADGVPPYAGIFNSVGPLADAVPGLAIWAGRLVGVGPVPAERLVFSLLASGCCALLCVLGRDVFGSRAAGLVGPAVFLTFEDFLWLASDGPREKTTMVLLLLATLILLGRRRWLLAGVCTALATLTWQPVLAAAVAAALVAVLFAGQRRLRAAAAFVVGGAIPSAVAVAYFALEGDLHLALDGFVVVNVEYTHQPSLLSAPGLTRTFVWDGYHQSLWLLLAGLAALLVLSLVALLHVLRREAGGATSSRAVLMVGAAALAGTAWTVSAANGAPDLFELLPFAALGVSGLLVALTAALRPRPARLLLGAVTAAATAIAGVEAVTTRDDGLDQESADVSAVLASAPPGASLLSINAPEVLALADRSNPGRYQIFDPSMVRYFDHTRPGGVRGYAARIAREQPTLVVTDRRGLPPWLRPALDGDYRCVGRGPRWTWYLSRTVAPSDVSRIEGANRRAMGDPSPVHAGAGRC